LAYSSYQKITRNLFDPLSNDIFRISRSKLELFMTCPRCFYLDRRLGIKRPDMPSFNLNNAVDTLLKKEFDIYRMKKQPHPLMRQYGINAVPFLHCDLEKWRHNFTGISYHHIPTNFIVFGAVDDLWIAEHENLIIVDYKATSSTEEITLDSAYRQAYKRQVEIYQWLFRKNNFKVSDTAYFVYCNGLSDKQTFDNKLEFDIKIIPYQGHDEWVSDVILSAHNCLTQDQVPPPAETCDYCLYRRFASETDNFFHK
jgi:CRISPR/Cas system-associated exonuclease Cas4 (RecB family)